MDDPSLEERDEDGKTFLHLAAEGGDEKATNLFLSKNAEANIWDEQGNTPLYYAAREGHLGVVKLLVAHLRKRGSQVGEAITSTALDQAEIFEHMEVAAFLRENGIGTENRSRGKQKGNNSQEEDNDEKDGDDKEGSDDEESYEFDMDRREKERLFVAMRHSPLDVACKLVERFIKLPAPVYRNDYERRLACARRCIGGRAALPDEAPMPLHLAVEVGFKEVVSILLDKGVDPMVATRAGVTPFMLACEKGHEEVVDILIQRMAGQGLEVRDGEGRTPLFNSLINRQLDIAQLLLPHLDKTAVDQVDSCGKTAMHVAAHRGHTDVVRFLSKEGASLILQDIKGETPLIEAARALELGCVKTLLERLDISSLHTRDARGRTALHWAIDYNAYAYDDPDKSDEEAERPRAWVEDVVRALLLAGADHTIVDGQGMTPSALALTLTQKYGMKGAVSVLDWWEVRRHELAEHYSSSGQATAGKGKATASQVQAGKKGTKRPREEGDSHEVQGLATGGGGKKHKTCRVS